MRVYRAYRVAALVEIVGIGGLPTEPTEGLVALLSAAHARVDVVRGQFLQRRLAPLQASTAGAGLEVRGSIMRSVGSTGCGNTGRPFRSVGLLALASTAATALAFLEHR